MKTDVIQIPIPKGHTASFDEKSGKITFKKLPENVKDRIKTVADVIIDNNMSVDDFEESCLELEPDEKAYRILKLLAKSLNEGWQPNWNDDNEYKYFAWFYMGGSSRFQYNDYDNWNSNSNVSSHLCKMNYSYRRPCP